MGFEGDSHVRSDEISARLNREVDRRKRDKYTVPTDPSSGLTNTSATQRAQWYADDLAVLTLVNKHDRKSLLGLGIHGEGYQARGRTVSHGSFHLLS